MFTNCGDNLAFLSSYRLNRGRDRPPRNRDGKWLSCCSTVHKVPLIVYLKKSHQSPTQPSYSSYFFWLATCCLKYNSGFGYDAVALFSADKQRHQTEGSSLRQHCPICVKEAFVIFEPQNALGRLLPGFSIILSNQVHSGWLACP